MEQLNTIIEEIGKYDEGIHTLNKGVSEQAITNTEYTIGVKLPEDYKEFMKVHNGGGLYSGGVELVAIQDTRGDITYTGNLLHNCWEGEPKNYLKIGEIGNGDEIRIQYEGNETKIRYWNKETGESVYFDTYLNWLENELAVSSYYMGYDGNYKISRLGYLEHVESKLGEIEGHWVNDNGVGCDVLKFKNYLYGNVKVYSTLGMSDVVIKDGDKDSETRTEYFLLSKEEQELRQTPEVMWIVASEAYTTGRAFAHGDVIGPRGEIFEGYKLTAFYVTTPKRFPEGFEMYEGEEDVKSVQLIPIYSEESDYIKKYGYLNFDIKLEETKEDLADYLRKSII